MSMTLKWVFTMIVSATVGCSVINDIKDTKKAAKEMQESTERLTKNTEDVSASSESMLTSGREALSAMSASSAFEELLETEDDDLRLTKSVNIFLAMEFQHWRGAGSDTLEIRDELMTKAVTWFFGNPGALVSNDFEIDPWFLDGVWRTIGSLAVAMSRVHPTQKHVVKETGHKEYSFYDILVEGLKYESDSARGEEIPSWAKIVLQNKPKAIHFLQMRHNYFRLVLASRLVSLSLWNFIGNYLYVYTWTADLTDLNTENYNQFNDWLKKIMQTEADLVDLDVNPEYNSKAQRVWENMVLTSQDSHNFLNVNDGNSALVKAREEFVSNLAAAMGREYIVKERRSSK